MVRARLPETADASSGARATTATAEPGQKKGTPSAAVNDKHESSLGVWQRLRAAGALAVGQLGIITALAFYFGWTHTQAYLRYFGLDTSLVQYTTTDYVLRSVGASYWPLMALGSSTVIALAIH